MVLTATFVIGTAKIWALPVVSDANTSPRQPSAAQVPIQADPPGRHQEILETTNIIDAAPPKLTAAPRTLFMIDDPQAITPRLGLLLDLLATYPTEVNTETFGVTWTKPSSTPWHWVVGGDILAVGNAISPVIERRYQILSGCVFRPYLAMGLKTRLLAKEELATLVNFNNVQISLATGFSQSIYHHWSLDFEGEYAFGIRFRTVMLFFGASRGF